MSASFWSRVLRFLIYYLTRQATCVQRNNEKRLFKYCCSGKAMSITYCECVFVALGFQHEMRMRHVVVCALLALHYFSTLSHKRHGFRKKN
jgi:hypothetical protein